MAGLSREHRSMLREAVHASNSGSERPLKRQKKRSRKAKTGQDTVKAEESEVIDLTSPQMSPQAPQMQTVINLDFEQQTPDPRMEFDESVEEGDEDDEDDDDEFEDVDLDNVVPKASNAISDVISLRAIDQEPVAKKMRNVIDKEERLLRKTIHRNYLATMMVHGFIRSQWCSDEDVHKHLRKLITVKIYDELHPSKSIKMPQIRTRQFLDGLRHLLERWLKHYRVTSSKGLYKHDWYDWEDLKCRSPTPFSRFKKCLLKGRGSRDIGAQGFVALLRAADVPSRLVFSLQPPDFTNMQIKKRKEKVTSTTGPSTIQDKVIALRKSTRPVALGEMASIAEIEMKYPVFWAEAWDTVSKTWYTIDPIMFKIIENVKNKSKLEPPMSYPYNNLTYVIGYDRQGGVKDITKRYAEKYYARTRKKRITKDESEDIWYSGFIDALSVRKPNRADEYEQEYFTKKAELEGMPDNIQDFKNHPFYILERDLRANEILKPKESCGMLRIKGKNNSIPVYKRSCVKHLRSPRAWYQFGRILKPGQQPLKVRQKTSAQMARNMSYDGDNEDREERLYADFQTELYIPPPATNGLIEKNAYGNIDIFVPSMVPEGAVWIKTPYAEDAAKLLEIDYAPAVVGFKFDRRQATPRIEGIVVGEDFKDVIPQVQEQLKNEDLQKQAMQLEIRALKGWNLMLSKMRIKRRLDKSHGKIDEDEEIQHSGSADEFEQLQREYEESMGNVAEDDSESEVQPQQKEFEVGGFCVEDIQRPQLGEVEEDEQYEGGFIVDDEPSGGFGQENSPELSHDDNETESFTRENESGGFMIPDDEENFESGGFIKETDVTETGSLIDGSEEPEAGGFIIDEKGETVSVPFVESTTAQYDEMDGYEAFMNNLEDVSSEDEEGEIGDIERQLHPSKPVEILHGSDFAVDEVTAFASPLAITPKASSPRPEVSNAKSQNDHFPINDQINGSTRLLQEPHDTNNDNDDEFETHFNEQLMQEQRMASEEPIEVQDPYEDYDDDFEYDSD